MTDDVRDDKVAVKEKIINPKKRKEYKKAGILILSFVVPVVIYMALLCYLGFYPNGTKTLLFMDLKGEYTEYMASLRYIFGGDDSLFFSWSRSMGGNVMGLYAFYSGGIFSFITCLFPVSYMYVAMEVLILILIGLCGLNFAVFIEWGVSDKHAGAGVVIFSTCYALMSYNMVYSNCYMWLTGCVFLPLVFLGIEKILRGERGIFFYIVLTLSIINNYYTAYMICLFSILYIIFRFIGIYVRDKKTGRSNIRDLVKSGIRYISLALLSVLSSAPVLYVVIKDLMTGKLVSDSDWTTTDTYYDFIEVFDKFLPAKYDSITTDNIHPSLYFGAIALVFCILYFFIKKVKIREKIAAFTIIMIMLISFTYVDIDKIWHGFQIPHWFPFRYAFLLSFFMIYLAYKTYEYIVCEKLYKRFDKKYIKVSVPVILLVISALDLSYNGADFIEGLGEQFGYMDISEYEEFYDSTYPLVKEVKDKEHGLYRMDKDYEFSKNDAMLLGYHGMTHYSSTYNAAVNTLTPKLGLAQSWYWNSGYGATPLVDAIFGVKYRMAKKSMPSAYKKISENDDVTLYENTLALPVGFAASENILSADEPVYDVFSNQNMIMSSIMGENNTYLRLLGFNRSDGDNEVILSTKAEDDGPIYMYIQPTGGYWGDIYVNDRFVSNYFSTETTCAVYLGTFTKGEYLNISVKSDNAAFDNVWIASLDLSQLAKDILVLSESGMHIDDYGAGSISGTFKCDKGQVLLTSIPYDEGFTLRVDGKKYDYVKWLDTFIAVKLQKGEHEISLSYTPDGFTQGLIISLIAIFTMIIYVCRGHYIIKKQNK